MNVRSVWSAGIRMGLASLRREPVLGLKRIVLPASYWRSVEFAYVWSRIAKDGYWRLLDLGSPKDLAGFLARHAGREVVATDILDSAVSISERYSRAQGIAGRGRGKVCSETQDGRSLTYADGSFDAAFSVSVLEHIPEDGDRDAIAELVRVVRPGGVIVGTVPYALEHRETFVEGDVYERSASEGEALFFERHYDRRSLADRLLKVPRTRLVDLQFWGEPRLGMEHVLNRLGSLRTALSPVEAPLAAIFLRQVSGEASVAKAAFFTLEKL